MNTASAGQPSPWVVYDYEVDMLRQTLNLGSKGLEKFQHPIPNAVVESMLLHLRILTDILLSRSSDRDDITLADLLPRFNSPLLDELLSRYGNSKMVGTPCWTLNKMMAHATQLRSASYTYNRVVDVLVPIIFSLVDEIAKARP